MHILFTMPALNRKEFMAPMFIPKLVNWNMSRALYRAGKRDMKRENQAIPIKSSGVTNHY